MATDAQKRLEKSVATVAGEAVSRQGYVSATDVLIGIGWLSKEKFAAWRTGQVPYLERVVIANLSKISRAMKAFRGWAKHSKLEPRPGAYRHRSHSLRFSKSGTPSIEEAYRTHFILVKKPSDSRARQVDRNRSSSGLVFCAAQLANEQLVAAVGAPTIPTSRVCSPESSRL